MSLTFPEYESFDGLGLADLIKEGEITSAEVIEAAIERIELKNPMLNAVIHKTYEAAKNTSILSGPFQGVPILLKDLLADLAGTPISFGSRYAYDNHWISQHDSLLVQRLKQSGVVILGKTNVPEFGLSPVTEPEAFGPTRNPWDLERTPGGSSGGSAAAVASGMVPIAHGGDGGGSIRMPAAFTGLFGFKPSRGRTPTGPVFMRIWLGMVVEHALTRTVRDSAAMLDVLAGPEVGSPISLPLSSTPFLSQLDEPLQPLRIAMIEVPFFEAKVKPEYLNAQRQAAKLCETLGHKVELETFSLNQDVPFALLIMMIAETMSGVKELAKHIGRLPKAHELEKATAMLCHAAEEFSAADYSWAVHTLDQVGYQLALFFEKYDVILTPTLPFSAPKIGENDPDVKEQFGISLLRYLPYGSLLKQFLHRAAGKKFSFAAFTALFNICGNPAMSVPLYWDENNMPIGIQFAAPVGEDARLLKLARQLERALPWFNKRPQ